jgi:UDP-3-O-[3-hydroxymyristoyl] glucosamine N-acyltransferase
VSVSLGELAVRFGCELRGNPDTSIERVAPLGNADACSISFLVNSRYRQQLTETHAAAVILDAASAPYCPVAALVCANPFATYARIAGILNPPPAVPPGVHATAVVAESARVDPSANIGPLCVIGERAVIGARAVIGPHCVIEDDVRVAEDVRLVARVTLCHGVTLGPRCLLHPGSVIGADGFGFAPEARKWVKVPQIGSVRLGSDVEIGANTTVDRGAIEDTLLEDGVKLDNQIQIGHNVRIGAHTAIAACTGISGSTTIGSRCQIAGMVAMGGHLDICDDVVILGTSMISHSITSPGVYCSGIPFEEARTWRRLVGHFKRLGLYAERLKKLERRAGDPPQQEEAPEQERHDD